METQKKIYYTNNSIGQAVGTPYKTNVPLKEFIDFLTDMLEKGGERLSITPYQNGKYQSMEIYRNKSEEEIRHEEIEELERRIKELKSMELNEKKN